MYSIRYEQQCVNRWFKADSYTDAMELFFNLSKVVRFVQVWHGDEMVAEYKN
jgi:hypothetical protein